MVENVTQIKSGIIINVGVSGKIQKDIMHVKKITFKILLHVVVKNGEYLRSSIEDSITSDEIVNAAKSVSINVPTNVTYIVLTNFHNKKGRYKMGCYILCTVSLVIILLFTIAITCFHYTKHRSKLKNVLPC